MSVDIRTGKIRRYYKAFKFLGIKVWHSPKLQYECISSCDGSVYWEDVMDVSKYGIWDK